jgi:uncharacterized protein involved in exopolysaccharide biosynthesis
MQEITNSTSIDEIDMREMFSALWAYKLMIVFSCLIGIFTSGYYSLTVEKKYTAVAIFTIDDSNQGIDKFSSMSPIAALSSFGLGGETDKILFDEIIGRNFIENLDQIVGLRSDPFFNTYKLPTNTVEPAWKKFIKNKIKWQKIIPDTSEATWQTIVSRYIQNTSFDITDNGSIRIEVSHKDAKRASLIANAIMNEIIRNSKNKSRKTQDLQINYLSITIAEALSDIKNAQSRLKNFALENSALPLENFTTESVQLDFLRDQINKTTKLHEALVEIEQILRTNSYAKEDYLSLRNKFPIVDQVEFRRVLGQSEIVSSWNWPDIKSVTEVLNTLSERKRRLTNEIDDAQLNAKSAADALETYANLERDATIAEATYTVLIEQVKAQSILAGFLPEKSEIFENAAPPLGPSAPNRNNYMALGAVIGLVFGSVFALILAFMRSTYYSKRFLLENVHARLNTNAKFLKPFRRRNLKDIANIITYKPCTALRDFIIEMNKMPSSQIVFTSLQSRLKGVDIAKVLAQYMQSETSKIAIIDFSMKSQNKEPKDNENLLDSFRIIEEVGPVLILNPYIDQNAVELLKHRDFQKKLKLLQTSFDFLFVCADDADAISLSTAISGQQITHISIVRLKHTKSKNLNKMRSLLPIQGLFYE